MKLLFSPQAEQDADKVDAWWRKHRASARDLFAEELSTACNQILRTPLMLKPYCERNGVVIRRCLLRKTEQHVYYEVDLESELLTVLRVWGARRRSGPKM